MSIDPRSPAAAVSTRRRLASLWQLVIAQMKQRIHMRNAQFGRPLSERRAPGWQRKDLAA
jgi:hypothetical protein